MSNATIDARTEQTLEALAPYMARYLDRGLTFDAAFVRAEADMRAACEEMIEQSTPRSRKQMELMIQRIVGRYYR